MTRDLFKCLILYIYIYCLILFILFNLTLKLWGPQYNITYLLSARIRKNAITWKTFRKEKDHKWILQYHDEILEYTKETNLFTLNLQNRCKSIQVKSILILNPNIIPCVS